jgi:hypothetical protein
MNYIVSWQVVSLVYKLSEDGTDVTKHVGVMKDRTDVIALHAFVWPYR